MISFQQNFEESPISPGHLAFYDITFFCISGQLPAGGFIVHLNQPQGRVYTK